MAKARVKIYGHPGFEPYRKDELESEFVTEGGMHCSGTPYFTEESPSQKPQGACFFVAPINYEGLGPWMPRARYDHLIFMHKFNKQDRRGEYFHIPFGGKIDISAE